MLRFLVLISALVGIAWFSPAEARRAALIIGNSGYQHTSLLPNPAKDAQLVADSAKRAGFDVTMVTDLTKADFDQTLREFRQQADGAEVAMIYYAGHGIQSGGANWVIPIDAKLGESRDLRFEAIDLDGLLETLIGAQLRMVVLDACRDNPFGSNWRSAVRSVPRGLAEQETEGALIIFAAAAGQVATDGSGVNSPFARSLANRLIEPGLSIHRLGSVIREDVVSETGGKQTPWTNMSIDGREFFLVDNAGSNGAPAAQGATIANANSDAFAWRYYSERNTADAYRQYVREFPSGLFVQQANDRIAQLGSSGRPVAPPVAANARTTGPAPSPAPARPAASAPARPAAAAVVPPTTSPPTGATGANIAAFQPSALVDQAPLPALPATPLFPKDGYPGCREEYASVLDPIAKVVKINDCLSQLTNYFSTVMNGYSASMISHQQTLTQLYQSRVGGQERYTPESQNRFYKEMMKEHAESNPDGAHFADYRAAKKRYDDDRAYLQDRYCASTGACGGYPVPAGVAPTTIRN
jgi:uncharacterized caspase-like protein